MIITCQLTKPNELFKIFALKLKFNNSQRLRRFKNSTY